MVARKGKNIGRTEVFPHLVWRTGWKKLDLMSEFRAAIQGLLDCGRLIKIWTRTNDHTGDPGIPGCSQCYSVQELEAPLLSTYSSNAEDEHMVISDPPLSAYTLPYSIFGEGRRNWDTTWQNDMLIAWDRARSNTEEACSVV
jgi:hypothetical protein